MEEIFENQNLHVKLPKEVTECLREAARHYTKAVVNAVSMLYDDPEDCNTNELMQVLLPAFMKEYDEVFDEVLEEMDD